MVGANVLSFVFVFLISTLCFAAAHPSSQGYLEGRYNTELLFQERSKFDYLQKMEHNRARLETARAAAKMRAKQFKRVEKIFNEGHTTQLKFLEAKMRKVQAEGYVKEVVAHIENDQALAKYHHIQSQEASQGSNDLQLEAVQSIDRSWLASRDILVAQKKQIEAELKYLQFYFEAGKKLSRKGHLSDLALETRELGVINARQRILAIESLLHSMGQARQGTKQAVEKLGR